MLPTQEEQDIKYREIEDMRIHDKTITYSKIAKKFAKWYAEQVVKHCAEVAKAGYITSKHQDDTDIIFLVDKQSILTVINEL